MASSFSLSPAEPAEGVEFFRFVKRRWKLIALVVSVALVLAAIVTSFIPKKYYSSGIVFPVYQYSAESYVDNPTFGYDVEADRLLQVLQSNTLRDSIVQLYRLEQYYSIDKSSPSWRDELKEHFNHDINFERSPYMSIVISAETHDPELSAKIVNSIIDMIDGLRERIIKKNFGEVYQSLGVEYAQKKQLVDSLARRINSMHEKDNGMMATINAQGAIQIAGNGKDALSAEFEVLLNQFIYEQTRLNEISTRYERAHIALASPITKVFQIDRAEVSYKKTSPSYLVNLALSGIVALVLSIIVLLFYEKIQRLRDQL